MKSNIKNLTITIALFGSMSACATTSPVVYSEAPDVTRDTYTERALPQNDIDQEAAGSFDSTKSQDRYLNAPAKNMMDRKNAKTKDMHKGMHESMHPGPADGAIVMGNDSTVISVQKALNSLDYRAGSVDGIMGPKTMSALEKFQKDNNITETGRLNSETLEALQIGERSIFDDDFEDNAYGE